jgi:hypothetical protein
MFGRVDLDVSLAGQCEAMGRKPLWAHVGDCDVSLRAIRRDGLDSDEDIHADGGGQDIIEVIINVLANNIDAAWTPCHPIGRMVVEAGKSGEQSTPACLNVGGDDSCRVALVSGIDVGNIICLWNKV